MAPPEPPDPGRSHPSRTARHGRVSTALALRNDEQLARLVAAGAAAGSGVGGASAVLRVEDAPVFVKRIPLTDLEREPHHVRSTANLFGLPAVCHYGVGAYVGPGFGAWRELAASIMTTDWVLGGRSGAFPLLYHWRVLPGAGALSDELADTERLVAYWDGSVAVRRRLRALGEASASVVLFLEHFPHTVQDWLAAELAAGPERLAAACAAVERQLSHVVGFLNTHGLLHFDAHFRNVLTDGSRLFLTDFGLALSDRFELSADEGALLSSQKDHDAAYVLRELLNWLVAHAVGIREPAERHAYLRRCAAGGEPVGAPAPVRGFITRYAPAAAALNDFYWRVAGESRTTPYPAAEIARALAATAE